MGHQPSGSSVFSWKRPHQKAQAAEFRSLKKKKYKSTLGLREKDTRCIRTHKTFNYSLHRRLVNLNPRRMEPSTHPLPSRGRLVGGGVSQSIGSSVGQKVCDLPKPRTNGEIKQQEILKKERTIHTTAVKQQSDVSRAPFSVSSRSARRCMCDCWTGLVRVA